MSDHAFKLAVCQIRTELDKKLTMDKAERMVCEAAGNGANVVVLPEMYNCPYSKKYFQAFADAENGGSVERMSAWARENGIILVGGSIPEKADGKLYNTCFVFNETGKIIARHRKMHLFDVDIEGGIRFKESNHFAAGRDITTFDTKYGKMGVLVCFDMRFPELVRAMARRGAEVVICPAQFNMTTGPKHWELTVRARAMDNEIYYVGASAARYEGFDYECWGHSTVADPFGQVIATCDETEQIIYADIDLNKVDKVRRELPTFLHLRDDIYKVAD